MKLPSSAISLLSAAIFVLLFYQQGAGINVGIYATATIIFMLIFKTEFFKQGLNAAVAAGLFISAVSYGLFGSPFAMLMVLISYLLLMGLYNVEHLRNILYAIPIGFANFFSSWTDFFQSLFKHRWFKGGKRLSKYWRILFLPSIVILVFILLYSLGSQQFGQWVLNQIEAAMKRLEGFFTLWNMQLVFTAVLGLIFSVFHSLKRRSHWISQSEQAHKDQLKRIRRKERHYFRNLDLKFEYRSAVFLFASLNVLLAIFLIMEINNEWINFSWDGEFLKGSVHQGTYVLIFSILLSIFLSAYFFRRNLNFLAKNQWLKGLVYAWIGLNLLLVISVGIRNHHYIEYFALAYKRIGVYFFLLLCLVGLVSLAFKIHAKKTSFYLIRINALAIYIGLIGLCTVNWDVFIAKYNLSHADRSFVHLDFLLDLSDKALPYLVLSPEEVLEIENKQLQAIPFAERGYFDSTQYVERIDQRIARFQNEQRSKHWLSKVWAEQKALQMLENQD